jgi:hypothetical protein
MTQGLGVFQEQVSKIADLGRYEDTYIAHVAEGETVVPMDVLDSNPRLKALLFNQMLSMGIDPERYIVGNELNSINPVTGQPEFFLKKIFKSAKKALKKIAPYAGTIAGIMGLGPAASALIGAGAPLLAGQGAGTALAGGLGGYGVGKAFGTGELGKKLPFQDLLNKNPNPYALAKDRSVNQSMFGQIKDNLGGTSTYKQNYLDRANQNATDTALSKTLDAVGVKDISEIKTQDQREAFDFFQKRFAAPIIPEKKPFFETTAGGLASVFGPMALGAAANYFDRDKDEDSKLDGSFYEVSPKNPFMFQGATIQRSASGGMMRDPNEIYYEDAYADGGLSSLDEFPRMNGQISGPGGPKDDLVPAMLSDGEFVMTARAVENAGGPQAMYNLMNRLDPDSSTGMGVM